ncbi:hypothetical protein BX616_001942 [Lobosporangium transversale]|uniref:CRAL-TRIO domain-containing protein n=1 Tax=Lobosporangium transversale TaxID=64571 RepID=A0A1Y2GEY7_9FUNG|nr:CRAL-TRIO domain-containing protein [Lobosporangium transversale]KAF9902409.1 hypothetical protein BX616_001942 [Lobosporangium transversale]ORZ09025.1 CRAL-TRIO domain-containing protein [Lobosporangium transversale]|eukprot:XP_021878652.1 CRAL-TRIO domain-containing protein [Lobosporangium transversale]
MNTAEKTTIELLELYQEHIQQVTELQHLVQQQYPPQHPSYDIATSYLNDRITLFRFLKKANYVIKEAYNLVEANIAWRIEVGCDHITPRDLEENPLWINGLVQLRGQDRYGHPLITIRLGKYVSAPQLDYDPEMVTDAGAEKDRFFEYKRYIIFVLECTRKLLWESSRRQPPQDHALQATLILDLQGASVSDLDHQLITFTIELLKHRYPSCIAQVYVLNYSWVFGGIWQMLKRALPETARARVSFPSSVNELQEHFDREELSTDFGGLDSYQYDSETCEAFHYFGYPMLSLQPGTPTSSLSRVNSCDSIYFDAISTPHHSPKLRPHDGLSFLSMTPMMPMAPPSSGHSSHNNNNNNNTNLSVRPGLGSRSNSIPLMDLNSLSPTTHNHQRHHGSGHHFNPSLKSTPLRATLLRHSKSSANIPSFMITPSIESDLPTQYPISRKERNTISRNSGSDPKNPRGNRFYRLILRPNSVFMRIAATQQGVRQKMVKVVKTCADKMMRTDMRTLMYWIMALIMLRGEVWQLIAATAVKVLTVVGEGDELLL